MTETWVGPWGLSGTLVERESRGLKSKEGEMCVHELAGQRHLPTDEHAERPVGRVKVGQEVREAHRR